jgi:hypothetical protein
LLYFGEAAASSGFASLQITRPAARAGLIATASIILLGEIGSSVLVLLFGALEMVFFKLFLTMSAFPLFCVVAGARVLRKVQRSLHNLPERLFDKLVLAMRMSIRLNLALALLGPMVVFAVANPLVYVGFSIVCTPLELFHSYVTVTAFKPIGVSVPTGPIAVILEAVGRALAKAGRVRAKARVEPTSAVSVHAASAMFDRRSSGPDPETGLPSYLLLGVARLSPRVHRRASDRRRSHDRGGCGNRA